MLSRESKKIANNARKLYDEKYRQSLEASNHGEFVCIEPESSECFLGATFDEEVNKAIDAYPNCLTHTLRIGHSAVFHLGVMVQ